MGLGSPAYTFHGGTEPTRDDERAHRLAQTKKSIAELAPFFAEHGAQMNIEILPRSCGGNCVEEIQYFMDGQPDNVGVVFDVNHVMNRAEQLPAMIRALAPRLHAFHLSDFDKVDEQHWTIPHCGVINWQAVMEAIREIPQDVYMIFETHCPQSVTWRGNTEYDSIIRLFEYSAYYLENVDQFAELDRAFKDFKLPGN
ncbi:MAG: sugar phosphate isomerase/epimerase [Lentisphaeria bacterium]|nr:sugar phosphate isomerase/epimerase [Lentisphaeria bacterium]